MEIDFNIPFFEQDQEVQNYLYGCMDKKLNPGYKTDIDSLGRVIAEYWLLPNTNYDIVRTSEYIGVSTALKNQNFLFIEKGEKV